METLSAKWAHQPSPKVSNTHWNLCDFLTNLTMSLKVAQPISVGCKLHIGNFYKRGLSKNRKDREEKLKEIKIKINKNVLG